MGTQLSDIVNVVITRETARITRVGFGTPCFLSEISQFQERMKTYTDPADMLDDGFVTTDAAYKAAVKIMAQELSPQSFKIGRKLADVNDLQTTTMDALATGGTYTITVGTQTTAAIAFDATTAQVETAIELLSNVTSVTVTGELDSATVQTIEFDGADANTEFATVVYNVTSLTGVTTATTVHTQWGSADEDWDAGLNAVIAYDEDFYVLTAETRTKAEIKALAAVIETKLKMYFTSTADADVLTAVSTDVASELSALSYDRTVYLYSGDAANYPECAWVGGLLPYDPGSITWKFKTLVGITADSLTASQIVNLVAKNANYYETIAGISMITSEAIVVGGEYIDVIRGVDWLQTRMQERIFTKLANSKKIPFTDPGIGAIETEVRNQMSDAADVGLVDRNTIVVDAPLVSEIAAADKADRYLDGITFSATLQGAVHKTRIVGKVVV